MKIDLTDKKILLTGGGGFLGQYVFQKLIDRGAKKENIIVPRSSDSDLREQSVCREITRGIDIVVHLAATVGGIGYNKENPAIVFYDNAAMALNLMDAAYKNGVKKFVGVGSVCAYPKFTPQPFKEESLWDGYPEESNAPYGIAKRLMLVQSQTYREQFGFNAIHLIPINLYGPRDNFDPASSHAIPALIRKVKEAQEAGLDHIEVWGTGKATREFVYVEDAAEAIIAATIGYDKSEPVNVGSGREISIKDLAETICRSMDFKGKLVWDNTKPDGQASRQLDTSRAQKEFGFKAKWSFEDGLKETIKWYLSQKK
ncbi:MAG: GDP-L-fucose synthase [bacterium]|nr:GDP-L-fucose synthase [bacterium]